MPLSRESGRPKRQNPSTIRRYSSDALAWQPLSLLRPTFSGLSNHLTTSTPRPPFTPLLVAGYKMDRAQTIGRPSTISRRNNRSRRIRNESSAYPRFNSFSAQDSRATGVDNNNILPTPSQTQASVAGISNDGKSAEVSSNELFIFRLYE